ncbi:hypothetical protein C8R43DRAFT_874103 [Mycena crocata]|nr:hypothetical protein C8R43DRAFT_874103 [Mycena crocata]
MAADLIIRTREGTPVDFHVHQAIISFASPVFRDMLESSYGDEFRDGKPVVIVHDTREALERLLPLCYPAFRTNSHPTTLEGVESALIAADKYQIPEAVDVLVQTLLDFAQKEPYRVFRIAVSSPISCGIAGLRIVVNVAALATLERPLIEKREDIVLSLPLLLSLYDFRTECGTAAARYALDISDCIDDADPRRGEDVGLHSAVWWSELEHGEGCGGRVEYPFPQDNSAPFLIYPTNWIREHMEHVAKALKICPTSKNVKRAMLDMRQTTYEQMCSKCRQRAVADLEQLVGELGNRIAEHNLQVSFPTCLCQGLKSQRLYLSQTVQKTPFALSG